MWDFGEHRAATAHSWVSATLDRIIFGEVTLEEFDKLEALAEICAEYIQAFNEIKDLTSKSDCDILST